MPVDAALEDAALEEDDVADDDVVDDDVVDDDVVDDDVADDDVADDDVVDDDAPAATVARGSCASTDELATSASDDTKQTAWKGDTPVEDSSPHRAAGRSRFAAIDSRKRGDGRERRAGALS